VKESEIQRAILDYLAVKKILCFRMNTGAMSGEHRGKKWFMRFGVPGMADILAFPVIQLPIDGYATKRICPVWIECKAPTGRQSALQASFEAQVVGEGHRYVLARSVSEVEAALL
jgi:hypothetical protein